jgi:hypothetical protein
LHLDLYGDWKCLPVWADGWIKSPSAHGFDGSFVQTETGAADKLDAAGAAVSEDDYI